MHPTSITDIRDLGRLRKRITEHPARRHRDPMQGQRTTSVQQAYSVQLLRRLAVCGGEFVAEIVSVFIPGS